MSQLSLAILGLLLPLSFAMLLGGAVSLAGDEPKEARGVGGNPVGLLTWIVVQTVRWKAENRARLIMIWSGLLGLILCVLIAKFGRQ